jgi:hypothetical protein
VEGNSCNTIRFQNNCKFIGNTNLATTLRGTGIKAYNTGILVEATNTVTYYHFENLTAGISANNLWATRAAVVHDARFNNNSLGIYMKGAALGNFYNNIINVPNNSQLQGRNFGIRCDGATNITVHSNTLSGPTAATLADGNRGVMVYNAGLNASYVGVNTLNNLMYSIQVQGTNGTNGSVSGLNLPCNTHNTGNYYDWVVNTDGTGALGQQGVGCNVQQTQSGNIFNDLPPCNPLSKNIWSGVPFTYVGASPGNQNPLCRSGLVTPNICSVPNSQNCTGFALFCTTQACNQQNVTAMNAETDKNKKDILRNRIINYYVLVDSVQMAIDLMTAANADPWNRLKVQALLNTNQITAAQSTLNALSNTTAEELAFRDLYQVLIDLYGSGQTTADMNTAQIATITTIANGSTRMRYTAQALLTGAQGVVYALVWDEIPPGGPQLNDLENADEHPIAGDELMAIPNPSNGHLQLRGAWLSGRHSAQVEILDATGRLVFSKEVDVNEAGTLDVGLTDQPTGLYIATVRTMTGDVTTVRIAVQH